MGLIQQLTDALSGRGKVSPASGNAAGKIIPTGYEAQAVGYGGTSEKKRTEYLEEMRGWVGACVTSISDSIASIDIKLYKIEGDSTEEVTEHPILDLLFKVNSFTTKFDHFSLTQSYLELTGEAPWFLERDGKGITSIYFLRPDRIRPLIGQSKMIEGYEYDLGGGQKLKLENDEVLFLKYPNPSKPYRGIGTLEQAAVTVDIDNYSERWNRDFYANSARPDSVITVNTPNMTPEQKDKLKTSFDKTYKGQENAHKTMLLFGEMKFEKSGLNQKDMDFLEQQRFSRDKILGIFRVPKVIVSQTEGVNYASAKTAEYVFAKYTIKPKMERLIQQLNEFLLPAFPGTENMFLDFDSPVPTDMEEKVKRYDSGLTNGWMTINEVREEQGLEAIEGGDVLYLPSGKETPEQIGQRQTQPVKVEGAKSKRVNRTRIIATKVRGKKYFKRKETELRTKRLIRETLIGEIAKQKKAPKVKHKDGLLQRVLTETEIKEYWTIKNAVFNKFLPEMEKAMIKIIKAEKKATLAKLTKSTKAEESSHDAEFYYDKVKLNSKKEAQKIVTISLPILTELFKESGDEAYKLLELDAEMEITAEIEKQLEFEARKFALSVVDTTNEEIKAQIEFSLKEGESVTELSHRLSAYFDESEQSKAERIARTETARYNTRASEQAFKDSGLVEGKMWVTSPTACEYCSQFKGVVTDLGADFAKKGDTMTLADGSSRVLDYEDIPAPPLHPHCECDIVPIFFSQKIVRKV